MYIFGDIPLQMKQTVNPVHLNRLWTDCLVALSRYKTWGAFFWENPNPDFRIQKRILRFLGGKSKNGSWIHKIHIQGGFFGSNPNPDFWDSQSERFFGKGFEKSIFDKRLFKKQKNGTQQMPYMYGILTEPVLASGALLILSHYTVTYHSMFVIYPHFLFVDCF